MRPPLLGVLFGLNFKLIGDSLALKFPVIFADSTHNDLLVFVNGSISTHLLSVIHLFLFSHFDFVHHLITVIDLLVGIVRLFFLKFFNFFVFWFFEIKVFSFQGLGCQLVQN